MFEANFSFFFLQRLESKKPTYIYPKIVGRDVLLMITFPLLLAKSLIQTSPFLTTNANLLGLLRSVQSLSHVRLFATPWTAAHQAFLSITNSQSLFKLMSIQSVMPSNCLILCHPLLLLPSIFPTIRVFSLVTFSHQEGKSIGVSAGALLMSIQG